MGRRKTKYTGAELISTLRERVEAKHSCLLREAEEQYRTDLAALDRAYRLTNNGAEPPIIGQD
jgi:hypothetical protein